jgi:hypothetical protein
MRILGTLQLEGSIIALDNGGNKTTITSNSPAGDIIITLPSTADTLVGRDTTDDLTNKTSIASAAANPATAGVLRLGNTETISWRNAANGANITLSVDANDEWNFNGTALTTTELGRLAGITSDVQTQLDAKLDDFSSTTDNALVRTDGGSGNAVQDSGIIISDTDAVSGVASLASAAANPASAGTLRLGNTQTLAWRNAANSADVTLSVDGSDEWNFNGTALTTTELGYLAGTTSAVQTQLDVKLDDVGTANDNEIPRFNTNGQALQNSGVTISDTDDIAGATSLASAAANPATAGAVRLGNTETLSWRNAANNANITLSIDSSDEWNFNGTALTTTELGYLAGTTSAVQTQLDAKLDDFTSSTDNAIVRTNGASGEAVQDSGILIDDSDNLTGVTSLTIDANSSIDVSGAGTLAIAASMGDNTLTLGSADDKTGTNVDVDILGVTALRLPQGTTAQRTTTPSAGEIRYNSDTGNIEAYTSSWAAFTSAATATPTAQGLVTSYFPTIQSAIHTVSSANYTVLDTDGYEHIHVTTGASDRTMTLPTAADNTGRKIVFRKVDSGTGNVILDGEGSETIDGGTTYTMGGQYSSMTVVCDGSEWWITEYPPNRSQTIALAVDESSTVTDIATNGNASNSGFKVTNLIVGKRYRLNIRAGFIIAGTTSTESLSLVATHNSAQLTLTSYRQDGNAEDRSIVRMSSVVLFTATATTITFNFSESGTGILEGDGTKSKTYIEIEELNNYSAETSIFNS